VDVKCGSRAKTIRPTFGAKPIEFEKGQGRHIVVSSKLPAVIDTLISAGWAGELDDRLNQAAKTGSIGKARKTA
jgi:hypothetical protein